MKPKIRFKGFDGEWGIHEFNELFTIISDSKSNVAKDRYLQYGKYPIIDQSKEFIVGYTNGLSPINPVNGGHVVFGDHTREIKFIDFPYYTGADGTQIMQNIGNNSSYFLYNICKSINIPNTGYNRHLKYLKEHTFVLPPSLPEQQAIASWFRALDILIVSSEKKLASLKQIKAASLQSMFPQEGETTPKVRFKGFVGEWVNFPLNKFANRIKRKNKNIESTLALTISSQDGLVSQIEYFNNLVVGANISNYYLLKKGEFAYNKSYSNGFPFGSIKRLDRYDQGILSTLYIVFGVNDEISSDYLVHFFDTDLWHKQVAERAEEGARNHGLLNIGTEDFMSINIILPSSFAEQQKIADYFANLDQQISLQTQRLEKLKQIKAACLDNMFV